MKNTSIDTLGLSVRSVNALHRAGIHTVGEMLMCTPESLSQTRNLGQKSVAEILEKIEQLRSPTETLAAEPSPQDAQSQTMAWLQARDTPISELELLSTKSYNLLLFNGMEKLHQIAFASVETLMEIPRMDEQAAREIHRHVQRYLREHQDAIAEAPQPRKATPQDIHQMLRMPAHQQAILDYVRANDLPIERMDVGNRAKNQLQRNGYAMLSDIIFMSEQELQRIPAMGTGSVTQVSQQIRQYLNTHETRLLAACSGDTAAVWDDAAIRSRILELYQDTPFAGFNLPELEQKLTITPKIPQQRLKGILGGMIADGLLEYVDYRCYRVYCKFSDYLPRCTTVTPREQEMLRLRLQGETLEGIAQIYGLTRERVRQIIKRGAEKLQTQYAAQTGVPFFDEDYYRYFYETYAVDKKDSAQWLGITPDVWTYLDMMEVKRGKKELELALEDTHSLSPGLRLKIKNYLNRNKIYVDGMWVDKNQTALERVVVEKFCTGDVDFKDFPRIYNDFLAREGIPYDEEIYYTESQYRSRKNVLSDSRFVLWKQNEMMRYYDIDSRDYTELLDTLNLDIYENIELSTQKFIDAYPEIMEKYDIRDRYELHNLLRKIVPEGSLHDFHSARMPDIRFGTFDREKAIWDIIVANAPISNNDLADLVYREYGYDPSVVLSYYVSAFGAYCHRGVYTIDHKQMGEENSRKLRAALTEDFYFIDEIRAIYQKLIPGADVEEVNPFSLKSMGLNVLSNYVLQHHDSLEAYFIHLLTHKDITDLRPLRARYIHVQMFHQTLLELKRNWEIIEFEPKVVIPFRKLARAGVTRQMLRNFCDQVWDFVEHGAYFSIQSLKQDGFASELFDLGFDDWFYASVLTADLRFSFGVMYGNLVFYRGKAEISIKTFLMHRIRAHGVIDVLDLAAELDDRYGCKVSEPRDFIYEVQNTVIYYDRILDRLYENAERYYRELDEMGDF